MLNENLTKIRKERGLTQEALAIKLNVVRQTVSKWEKGTAVPDADTLCRIANALDVSVSVLLGETGQEDPPDTAAIAKALAQINEQLAVRNRRSAAAWKAVCLISLLVIGILLWRVCCGTNRETAAVRLPDLIEVTDVRFLCTGEALTCSFVPSFGNDGVSYRITLRCNLPGVPDTVAVARYENGICTAAFDRSMLTDREEYCAVLTVEYRGEIRSVSLAGSLFFEENSCSWHF